MRSFSEAERVDMAWRWLERRRRAIVEGWNPDDVSIWLHPEVEGMFLIDPVRSAVADLLRRVPPDWEDHAVRGGCQPLRQPGAYFAWRADAREATERTLATLFLREPLVELNRAEARSAAREIERARLQASPAADEALVQSALSARGGVAKTRSSEQARRAFARWKRQQVPPWG